ncbi:MAG: NAD(P)/FAD-dependent oxidoreductase [Aliidongia sp.]
MRDVVIVGGGHNGLVCAAYLAKAGLGVTVLEARSVVGGAAVTEEFHPGFRNSVAAYTVSLLNPKIIADLELPAHGLRIVERRLSNFLPLEDGRYLKVGAGKTHDEVAKFSRRDADRLDAYAEKLDRRRRAARRRAASPAQPAGRRLARGLAGAAQGGTLARRLERLDIEHRRELLDLFAMSAGNYLDGWFESDPIKAVYGFDGIVGNFASPYQAGSAYVLLHHTFGEVNGKKGVWGHAIGGMGAITQAMARAARAAGVEIRTDAAVREVLVENGRSVGVVTRKGETIRGSAIVSNLNPKLLYRDLIDPAALPADFLRRITKWRCGSGTFRMNVALSELPDFTALPGRSMADHHASGIILAPSLGYMEQAFVDARRDGWVETADRRARHPLDPGRHTGAAGRPCRQPVLPACGARAAGRLILGRSPRDGGRSDDRDGRPLRAQFQGLGARPADQQPARSGTHLRPDRRRHLPRRARPQPDLLGPADARPCRLPRASARPLYVRLRHPSRRRRHRRAGAQCGPGRSSRFPAPKAETGVVASCLTSPLRPNGAERSC